MYHNFYIWGVVGYGVWCIAFMFGMQFASCLNNI